MEFDGQQIRRSQTPPIPRTWMAKKMGVGYMFLYRVERGQYPWPKKRKEQFEKIVADWQENPPAERRKRRNDIGRIRGKQKRDDAVQKTPVPVPHSHGEVVGIG